MSFVDYRENLILTEQKKRNDNTQLKASIMKLFSTDPKVTEMDIRKLSEKLNVSEGKIENIIFELLSSLLHKKYKKKHKIDQKELAIGIEHEKEHTKDSDLAKTIATDHLIEIPNYYTLLKAMEKKAK